jgi:hypothetical protein
VSAFDLGLAWRVDAVWREPSPAGGVGKATPFPPPPARSVWGNLQNFPHLFLGEVSLQGAVPLASPPKRSVRLSGGVAGTLAYPDVFEALVGRFRGD